MQDFNKPIEEMDDKEWQAWLDNYIENLQKIRQVSVKDFFK